VGRSEEQVRGLADLARLRLSDAEIRLFARQIDDILGYVSELERVEIEGARPMTHALGSAVRLREDIAKPSDREAMDREAVLGCGPDVGGDGAFRVPQVIGSEGRPK